MLLLALIAAVALWAADAPAGFSVQESGGLQRGHPCKKHGKRCCKKASKRCCKKASKRCCKKASKRCCKKASKRCPPPTASACPSRPFSNASVWDQPLAPDAPLSPNSAGHIAHLQTLLQRYGAWVNTTEWSTPVYTVCTRQADVPVTLDQLPHVHQGLRAALAQVPIPQGARPSSDPDGHIAVWQPGTDTLWELWKARRASDGWHAGFGGKMTDVSRSPGYFPKSPGWGATATGLPLLGGLIRISELRAGRIPHALSIAMPEPRAGIYAWPAQRTDGTSYHPFAIPEGTRLRIDPSLDLSTLPMSPFVRILSRAAQQYGMIVTDRGGAVAIYAEDPTPTGSNPYWPAPSGFYGGQSPGQFLQQFPWSRLQVVNAPLFSD